jgi:hypothetical protein
MLLSTFRQIFHVTYKVEGLLWHVKGHSLLNYLNILAGGRKLIYSEYRGKYNIYITPGKWFHIIQFF